MIWNQKKIIMSVMMSALLLVSSSAVAMNALSDENVAMDIGTKNEEKNAFEFEVVNQKEADLPVVNIDDAKEGEQNDGQMEPVTGFDQQAFEYKEYTDQVMAPEKCVCPCKAKPTTEYINGKWVQLANTQVPSEVLESPALNTPL